MPRKILLPLAGLLLMAQAVPAPVPRDLPGPAPAPGVTPPERLERPPLRPDGVIVPPGVPRGGVIVPPAMPPMPQADVPDETPGLPRGTPPPEGGPRFPPGPRIH